MEKEDNIIVRWAQEDVGTLYNLLNKQSTVCCYSKHVEDILLK